MQPHFLTFKPSADNYKQEINWNILDDELRETALSFFDKYNLSKCPFAVWKICKAEKKGGVCEIDGHKFSGKVFSMIENGQNVAVYIASCGNLDNKIYSDPIESFFSETLKRQACDMAMKYCNEKVSELFGSKICSINPGSGDPDLWPFEQLKDLVQILEDEKLPVKMLSSGLMYPTKSVAGILFNHEGNFTSCQFCSKVNCPDRDKNIKIIGGDNA